MERKKLEQEQKQMIESLNEKNDFVYSPEFYELDEEKRKQYIKAKMANESLVNSLTALLYDEHTASIGGLSEIFMLYLMTSMFGSNNGFATPTPSFDYLKETMKEETNAQIAENPA